MISRGFGGNGGKRSIITARGGAGSGGNCLKSLIQLKFEISMCFSFFVSITGLLL